MGNKGKKFNPEVLSTSEIDKFLGTFRKTITGTRNHTLITIYLRTLIRCDEALHLRTYDMDFIAGSLTVMEGKGGKRRVIGLDIPAIQVLKSWYRIKPTSKWVFCTAIGGQMSTSYVRQMVKRQAMKARIEKRVHTHCFRHTGACQLLEEGFDIRIISKQLGHESIHQTHRYLDHLQGGAVVTAIRSRDLVGSKTEHREEVGRNQ